MEINKSLVEQGSYLEKKALVWTLTKRQFCDVECILNGAFSPLNGFLNQDDYESVCENMRLTNGQLWPIPITLDVPEVFAENIQLGDEVILSNEENMPIALLKVASKWQYDREKEASLVFDSLDIQHPGVDYIFSETHPWYLGGTLTKLSPILHYDFITFRHTPAELKQLFNIMGWIKIVAFQTRNPIHRAHFELTKRAAKQVGGNLLLHPVVGVTKPGDIDSYTRVKCYERLLLKYLDQPVLLSLLPLAMRMAGPKEALWHALIRKNYGATHFIVGRDHAGPGVNSQKIPFYDPYAAQKLLKNYQDEIGIEVLSFPNMVYVKNKDHYVTENELSAQDTIEDISGTELRRRLQNRLTIPAWFSFPDVIELLQRSVPSKNQLGYTLFFTGLSGAGKSTIAKALIAKMQEISHRKITLLDGDVVRKHLSSELGFSKTDRDIHIKRLGYVASEITKHGGIAICAVIAPYEETRQWVRKLISEQGGFIEVYISTSVEECKKRDIKGLYRKAELGIIKEFTGVSGPYETPTKPEIVIDTSEVNVSDAVRQILQVIQKSGYYTISD